MIIDIKDIRTFSSKIYNHTFNMLSEERQNQINQLPTVEDRQRSVLGEYMARTMVGEYLGLSPEQVLIYKSANGKPLTNGAFFSISHSVIYVACAVDNKPIGIDIEMLRPIDPRLVKLICTANEQNTYFNMPQIKRDRFLLSLWVLKEARIKCMDCTLLEANQIGFSIDSNHQVHCDDQRFLCELHFPFPDFVMATCKLKAE